MQKSTSTLLCSALLLAAASPALAAPKNDPRFDALVKRYFDARFCSEPTWGTSVGRHEYDSLLEDYSLAGARADARDLHAFQRELQGFAPEKLNRVQRVDRAMILGAIDDSLQALEDLRPLENDPDVYSSGISVSAFSLVARDFAPLSTRLAALIERMRGMPEALRLGRRQLKKPPHVATQVALDQIGGNREIFAKTIPEAFAHTGTAQQRATLNALCKDVVKELDLYKAFLEKEVMPRSTGSFALGTKAYVRKWHDEEMVDVPLPRLLAIGYADLKRNQEAFRAEAAKIDPKATPAQVLDRLARTHVPASRLLSDAQGTLDEIRQFILDKQIVSLPNPKPLRVVETPPFMRATTTGALDSQGPFERRTTDAFFYITLPNPKWSAHEQDDYMGQFYPEGISNLAVHEAYPGHYLQYLTMPRLPSITRKLLGANTLTEGWAHYCEQMMLDEGFHAGQPSYKIAQLQDALLRDARLIVGVKLHTGGWTLEQATKFFQREGYQNAETAKSEAWRGASDPLYGYYTLGKLMIYKLRDDYKLSKGSQFSLKDFHDRLLSEGAAPMPLVREALLGKVGDPLPKP